MPFQNYLKHYGALKTVFVAIMDYLLTEGALQAFGRVGCETATGPGHEVLKVLPLLCVNLPDVGL